MRLQKKLYETVIKSVESQLCIYPISEDIFLEVIKQEDPATLDETVRLIDLLSLGVSQINFEEKLTLEFKYFLNCTRGKEVYKCQELVWTKLAYNMGFVTPQNKMLDPLTDQAIQKAFIDSMWSTPLSRVVSIIKDNGGFPNIKLGTQSGSLNDGKFSHSHENNSFKQMFMSEVAGFLDANETVYTNSMLNVYEKETGRNELSEQEIVEIERLAKKIVYNIFDQNKSQAYLPMLRICSGLYAAIRWDRNQKFQDNDLHDIRHAASALPYADLFLTEKRLAHLITQKVTGYDKLYSCNVQSQPKSALGALEAIVK